MILLPLIGALAAQGLSVDPLRPLDSPPPLAVQLPVQQGTSLDQLQRQLASIANASSSDVGIAVLDVASGRSISVHGHQRFPMASTVKVAIAATYLAEVEAGHRLLSDMIRVDERLRLRGGGLGAASPNLGALPARRLIELMLTHSDNTATDVLLHNLGGPATVQAWLKVNGVTGLRIDRSIAQLLLDLRGARVAKGLSPAETLRRWDPIEPGVVGEASTRSDRPSAALDGDVRDTATPLAFAEFLRRLYGGELLRPASRDYLFSVMSHCATGSNRIKGLLPAGTAVEHKTGTLSGVTADVGFISLPDGRRVIVAAFAKGGSNRPTVIARAARAAYDTFATLH